LGHPSQNPSPPAVGHSLKLSVCSGLHIGYLVYRNTRTPPEWAGGGCRCDLVCSATIVPFGIPCPAWLQHSSHNLLGSCHRSVLFTSYAVNPEHTTCTSQSNRSYHQQSPGEAKRRLLRSFGNGILLCTGASKEYEKNTRRKADMAFAYPHCDCICGAAGAANVRAGRIGR
jgi:hypothetical protein